MDIPDWNMNDLVQALVVLCLQKINDQRVPRRDIVGRRMQWRWYLHVAFLQQNVLEKKQQKTIENMHNLNMFSIFHPEPRDIFLNCHQLSGWNTSFWFIFPSTTHTPHRTKSRLDLPGPVTRRPVSLLTAWIHQLRDLGLIILGVTPPKKKHSWTGKNRKFMAIESIQMILDLCVFKSKSCDESGRYPPIQRLVYSFWIWVRQLRMDWFPIYDRDLLHGAAQTIWDLIKCGVSQRTSMKSVGLQILLWLQECILCSQQLGPSYLMVAAPRKAEPVTCRPWSFDEQQHFAGVSWGILRWPMGSETIYHDLLWDPYNP